MSFNCILCLFCYILFSVKTVSTEDTFKSTTTLLVYEHNLAGSIAFPHNRIILC